MRYHLLGADTPCPHCGRACLAYSRAGLHGDVYACDPEAGGCRRTAVHRRQKGGPGCGLAPVLNFGVITNWKPCKGADRPLPEAERHGGDSAVHV